MSTKELVQVFQEERTCALKRQKSKWKIIEVQKPGYPQNDFLLSLWNHRIQVFEEQMKVKDKQGADMK